MRSVSGGRLFWAMAIGVLGAIVAIALDAAISYLREDWTNPIGIVVTASIAAFSGLVPLLRADRRRDDASAQRPPVPSPSGPGYGAAQPYGSPPPYGHQPYGHPPPYGPPAAQTRRRSKGVPLLIGVLVLLLFCGGGVAATAFGARYLGGWFTGDEKGFDVLAEERSARAGDLTLTVHSVVLTSHYTRVEMSATNGGERSLNLPIFENCQLTLHGNADRSNSVGGRNTLEGDPFRSDWTESVPAGQTVRGIVTFDRLPEGITSINISFSMVYGQFEGNSITIEDVPLT